jgi:hypothetical protein
MNPIKVVDLDSVRANRERKKNGEKCGKDEYILWGRMPHD